jgi:hypothetical protein
MNHILSLVLLLDAQIHEIDILKTFQIQETDIAKSLWNAMECQRVTSRSTSARGGVQTDPWYEFVNLETVEYVGDGWCPHPSHLMNVSACICSK